MRGAAAAAFLLLLALYVATLAPGVTFWDAGELVAAVHSLGVPHPPGTPLYVLLARAWSDLLAWLPRAFATNLLSAACTAAAGGVAAWWIARTTGWRAHALAAALCAGATSTVWLNATETEVYAPALLLSWLAIAAAERAGRTGDGRWLVASAYALALSVPLHLSALVGAPAAIVLASRGEEGERRWADGLTLAGIAALAAAASALSPAAGIVALALLLAAALLQPRARQWVVVASGAAALLAFTALAAMLVRAAHDPAINAGDPSTLGALADVVSRRQYGGGQPLWPRQAPVWLQIGNLFEWFDWQFALGLAPGVAPAPARTGLTLLFCALAVWGARAHRHRDPRGWSALLALVVGASVGLVAYMNFKAGASFGWPFVPDAARHEARERDYFFALAFWGIAMWSGIGAVALLERFGTRGRVAGVLLAALPIALNWRAVDRRRSSDAGLARASAAAFLASAPPRAVIVAGGDNDAFPLWYLQAVEGARRDVTVVVAPLLGAQWYRAELARRHALLPAGVVRAWLGERETLERIAAAARASDRPIAVTLLAGGRRALIPPERRVLNGALFVERESAAGTVSVEPELRVDTAAAVAFARRFGRWSAEPAMRGIDPAPRLARRTIRCPAEALAAARGARPDSLDVTCNFR